MDNVKRYDFGDFYEEYTGEVYPCMNEALDGHFVKYTDYESLRQQLAKPVVEPLLEALRFIKDGNCATLQGAILHASHAIAAYDASK